uniref:Harbinger transposase-derived protein n=1 Tax=Lactuca sativa TaxID=4236 RepID=A0A9R1VQP6_LACSA|nr:hypothetical protein LSAT_V11C400170760 [Lactuca sativa]
MTGSDDDLILHTLLSAAQDLINERGESSHCEKKHRKWINRDREAAHELLVRDYFASDSLYDLAKFKDRLRISRTLFLRIARDLKHNYEFSQLRWMLELGYGITVDALDEYLKMFERTEFYRDIYLRHPTKSDVEQLYVAHQAKHGFPGMLGSIDCRHWEWANCPNAWRGQFTPGDHEVPTVILEAVVSHDLWFWHAFFGIARSNNDLNTLQASPLFNNILRGKAPDMSYVVNGNEYKYVYYLGDGIYLEYATFVKSYSFQVDEKRKLFKLA